jgi:hypothetical protein
VNRLIDAYRTWRMRRWMRGPCYVCDVQCETRIVAYKSGADGFHIDLHACPDHYRSVLDFVRAQINAGA